MRSGRSRSAGRRTQCRSDAGPGSWNAGCACSSWSAWRLSRCAGRLLARSSYRWLAGNTWWLLRWNARRLLRTGLCWRLSRRAGGWWSVRWRRRLLSGLLRRLSKGSQRNQAETQSKKCFHNFGGVEFKCSAHLFYPKRFGRESSKSFHFSLTTAHLGERHFILRMTGGLRM